MFKSKTVINNDISAFFSKGCKITGTIDFTGILTVNGELIGDIPRGQSLEIGPAGRVEGNVTVESANIHGAFKGIMHVKSQLVLHKGAMVEGEIFLATNNLETEPGARVEGTLHMPKSSDEPGKSSSSPLQQPLAAKK